MTGALLWARSEIRDGWRSLIVVGVLVAVVTGSVLALAGGAGRAGSAPDRFAESTDLAELIVFVGGAAPAELVDEIAADPRVERVVVSTVAKIGPGVASPESNAIIGQEDALGGYGRPFLVSGRYPEPGSTDEILVSERGALREGIAVGDRVPLSALECLECEAVSIGDAVVVGIVRLSEDLVDDPGGPARRPRRTDARRTVAGSAPTSRARSCRCTSPTASTGRRSPPTCRSTVGALGNASDQEVDIESVERAATLQRDALLLLAAVAAAAGAVVVAQAVSRHLQRRPSDAARARSRRPRPPAADRRRAGLGAPGGPRRRRRRCRASLWRSARPFHSGRSAEPRRSRGSASTRRCSPSARSLAPWSSRWRRCSRRCAGRAPRRRRPRPGAAPSPRSSSASGCAPRPPRAPASPSTPGTAPSASRSSRRWRPSASPSPSGSTRSSCTPTSTGWWTHRPGTASRGTTPSRATTPRIESPMREAARDPRVSSADLARSGELDVARRPDGQRARSRRSGSTASDGPTSLVMRSGRPPIGVEEIAVAGDTMADLGVAVGDRIELTRRLRAALGRGGRRGDRADRRPG